MKIIVVLVCLSLSFPFSVFAEGQTAAVQAEIIPINQALLQSGIKIFDSQGGEVSLLELSDRNNANNLELRSLIPSSPQLGLNKPLGIHEVLTIIPNGINTWITFTDENYSKILSSGSIFYDFNKSPQQNKADIDLAIGKIFSNIPRAVFSKNDIPQKGFTEKVAQLILPKAEAASSSTVDKVNKVLNGVGGVILAIWSTQLFRVAGSLPFTSFTFFGGGPALIVGALVMATASLESLLSAFGLDINCMNLGQFCGAPSGQVNTQVQRVSTAQSAP